MLLVAAVDRGGGGVCIERIFVWRGRGTQVELSEPKTDEFVVPPGIGIDPHESSTLRDRHVGVRHRLTGRVEHTSCDAADRLEPDNHEILRAGDDRDAARAEAREIDACGGVALEGGGDGPLAGGHSR